MITVPLLHFSRQDAGAKSRLAVSAQRFGLIMYKWLNGRAIQNP